MDTFDDWRDLLEEQERRIRDELDASRVGLQRTSLTDALFNARKTRGIIAKLNCDITANAVRTACDTSYKQSAITI